MIFIDCLLYQHHMIGISSFLCFYRYCWVSQSICQMLGHTVLRSFSLVFALKIGSDVQANWVKLENLAYFWASWDWEVRKLTTGEGEAGIAKYCIACCASCGIWGHSLSSKLKHSFFFFLTHTLHLESKVRLKHWSAGRNLVNSGSLL